MSFLECKYALTVIVGEKGTVCCSQIGERSFFCINPGDTLIVLDDINQGACHSA